MGINESELSDQHPSFCQAIFSHQLLKKTSVDKSRDESKLGAVP